MNFTTCTLQIPPWCQIFLSQLERFKTDDDKMSLTIELSKQNVLMNGGGPFGAVVFDADGRVVSVGVNIVVNSSCSAAHAEMMALMLAQQSLARHRLNEDGEEYTLASSAQPCSMCFGALPWAGIDRLVYGATRKEVETITGFDEGPIPENWCELLRQYNIETIPEIRREQATDILKLFVARNGKTY